MKSKRQEEILALIQEQNIETQNQLIAALRERGVKSTQATLSRDIRELRLVKELCPDGGYRYTVPTREDSGDQLERLRKIFRECVVSFDTAQNLVSTPQIFNTEYLRNPQNPKTITLSWNKVPKATDYYVSVLNRRGKEILSYNVKKGTSYTIDFKLLSEEDKIAFSKGTFYWTVKGVRRIDTDKDGNIDKILQESPEAKSSFETDIPTPKKSKAKGASNPYGN